MPSGYAVRARELVQKPIPDLIVSPNHTTKHALHRVSFLGPLAQWADFEADALAHHHVQQWPGQTITYRQAHGQEPSPASLSREQVPVGAEIGVQGRWVANIGHPISAINRAAGVDSVVTDWRACASPLGTGRGALIPDIAVMRAAGELQAVAEMKVPWHLEHDILLQTQTSGQGLRHLLGQTAEYMFATGLKYGFLSTYEQTIFLKAEVVNGQATLLYSHVILHDAVEQGGRATLLQCFLFFTHLASGQRVFQYTMPKSQWVG